MQRAGASTGAFRQSPASRHRPIDKLRRKAIDERRRTALVTRRQKRDDMSAPQCSQISDDRMFGRRRLDRHKRLGPRQPACKLFDAALELVIADRRAATEQQSRRIAESRQILV